MEKEKIIALAVVFAVILVGAASYGYWTQEVVIDTHIPVVYQVEICVPEEENTADSMDSESEDVLIVPESPADYKVQETEGETAVENTEPDMHLEFDDGNQGE